MPGKLLAIPFLLAILSACPPSAPAGEKDPNEQVVILMLGHLEKMAETLTAMKDKESAAKGREELKDLMRSFSDLRDKAEKLPPPNREVKERIAKEYKAKFIAVQEKLMLQVARVRSMVPGGREALTEVVPFLRNKELKDKAGEKKDKDKGSSD